MRSLPRVQLQEARREAGRGGTSGRARSRLDRDAVVRSMRTGRGSRARRRGRHSLRLSSALPGDSNATLRPRVAPSSGANSELLPPVTSRMDGTPRRRRSNVSRLLLATWIWVPGWLVFNTGRPEMLGRFTVWRSHAQASSCDVQPRASAASDRKRSHGFST